MPSVFKVTVIPHWLRNCWVGPDGQPCPEGTPGARFVKAHKVKAGTPCGPPAPTHQPPVMFRFAQGLSKPVTPGATG
jgi:hypothetical protein